MRILLAEDDELLGAGLRAGLLQQGFEVDWVRDGVIAEHELKAQLHQAAVLDLGLPRQDGLQVLQHIRQAGVNTPVLILTARDAVTDKVQGLTRDEILQHGPPSGPPDQWSLLDEVRASFDAERSGDFVVLLKPRVTPIPQAMPGYVATHGSAWDYDRRVPILFWRRGMVGFEQPAPVETVDIAPTLVAMTNAPAEKKAAITKGLPGKDFSRALAAPSAGAGDDAEAVIKGGGDIVTPHGADLRLEVGDLGRVGHRAEVVQLVELHVAAPGSVQRRQFLMIRNSKIGPELLDIRIGVAADAFAPRALIHVARTR